MREAEHKPDMELKITASMSLHILLSWDSYEVSIVKKLYKTLHVVNKIKIPYMDLFLKFGQLR